MSDQRLTPVAELIEYIRQNVTDLPEGYEEKFKEILDNEKEELTFAYAIGNVFNGKAYKWYYETYKTDNND